jgi:hypothetical protein
MKRLVVIGSIALALAVAGCDLFGTDATNIYVWGRVYEDAAHTTPAEGITVMLRGDSTTVYDQSVLTDANGTFFFEARVYPDMGGEEGGVGYSTNEFAIFGLEAWYNGMVYKWADVEDAPFTLGLGDTLRVADIDYTNFGAK